MDKEKSLLRPECRTALEAALKGLLRDYQQEHNGHHLVGTEKRVIKAFEEMLSGTNQDAGAVLITDFEEKQYDEMICVLDMDFFSVCAHHMQPFFGKAHFAYLPNKKVVGLSKIPRMIEILSRRLQIQEQLSEQITATFQEKVKPLGCGVQLKAWHGCVACRGIRSQNTRMLTTSLKGLFLSKAGVKEEFLSAIAGHSK